MSKRTKRANFFAEVPKPERALLSAYKGEGLTGKYGIRIELAPLLFTDPSLDTALEAEIILDHLSLPSIEPAKLRNTQFIPDSDEPPPFRYEGSCYFLGQHNWVDLKKIRFLEAERNTIIAEYHLVIDLPTGSDEVFTLVLTVRTDIESGDSNLEQPRTVEGLGTLINIEENTWQCEAIYDNCPIQVELRADPAAFEKVAAYLRSIIAEEAITPSRIREEIAKWIVIEKSRFEEFGVNPDFHSEDFVIRSFYSYLRRHHEEPELIIGLDHSSDVGHWSLSLTGYGNGVLNWVPKD